MTISINALLGLYFKHRILRPASVRNYVEAKRQLERFYMASGRALPNISDLTVDDLLDYRTWSLSRMAATSYNKHRRHLKALLNFAVAENFITVSPMAKVSAAPVALRRPKVVATNWYRRTMDLLDGPSVPGLVPQEFWRLVFSVMHFTGLRRRQLVELQWGDVLWNRHALLLRSEGSKSHREWVVPIPKWLTQQLREYRVLVETRLDQAVHPLDQLFCLPIFSPRIRAARMTEAHVSRAFEALSVQLGYTISSHRVRHTTATAMLGATGHLKGVSDMLGHADIKLTATAYVHPQLGHLRKVQSALSGYRSER